MRSQLIALLVLMCTAGCGAGGGNGTAIAAPVAIASQPGPAPVTTQSTATVRYLGFQIPMFRPARQGLSGAYMIDTSGSPAVVAQIVQAIGSSGDHVHTQVAAFYGPIAFDTSDADMRTLIQNAFAVAESNNVAVGFHIDDSMFWANRTDLWSNPDNVEWSDFSGTVVPHRIIAWAYGGDPVLAPPMCYNSPAITAEATRLAQQVIGPAIAQGIQHLNSIGRGYLFAGVIDGWETREQDDSNPVVYYGYHAVANLGFSAASPPPDFDLALQGVVAKWVLLWTQGLEAGGVPHSKVFTHIAYPGQPPPQIPNILRDFYHNSDPNVTAFNTVSNPGFSVYGSALLPGLQPILAGHGTPPWGVSEGTAIAGVDFLTQGGSNTDSMEPFLGGVFNHGGVYVNLFGWPLTTAQGLVGQDAPGGAFAQATAGPAAIAAYQKFLSGGQLSNP